MQQFVDRTTPQGGATSLRHPSAIQIVYNAEIRPQLCVTQIWLGLTCRCYDHSRSYLYLRENSIESNEGAEHMCGGFVQCLAEIVACPLQASYDLGNCVSCDFFRLMLPGFSAVKCLRKTVPCFKLADDTVDVVYFDRNYFYPTTEGCCCVQENLPKLEVVDHGCMVCCIRCRPLNNIICPCFTEPSKDVVVMPYETTKCCWCCDCANRVKWYHNCCGLCGKVTGSPLTYETFYPQPKNVEAFLAFAQPLAASRQFAGRDKRRPSTTFAQTASIPLQDTAPSMGTTHPDPVGEHELAAHPLPLATSTNAQTEGHLRQSPSEGFTQSQELDEARQQLEDNLRSTTESQKQQLEQHARQIAYSKERSVADQLALGSLQRELAEARQQLKNKRATETQLAEAPQDDFVDDDVNAAAPEAPIGNIKIITPREMKTILEQRRREKRLAVGVSSVSEGEITKQEMEMVMRRRACIEEARKIR